MQFWEVIKQGEFYLIFIFGMLPLFITHVLIENVTTTYKNSKKEYVDEDKNHNLQLLDRQMIDLDEEKALLNSRLKGLDESISENQNRISELEKNMNNIQNEIENKYELLLKRIKAIYDDYNSKVMSGRIFSDVILNSIISAYKTGFIDYLPHYYANEEIEIRIREIEKIILKYKEI